MSLWRYFRLRRTAGSSAPQREGSVEGLDAFGSEETSPTEADGSATAARRGSRIIPGLLAALVVLETGPAVLWLHGRVTATGIAAVGPSAAAPAPASLVLAPCEPSGPPAGGETAALQTAARSAAGAAAVPGTGSESAATRAPSAPDRAAPERAAAPALVAGLLSVDAPVPMQIYERGRLLGTTEAERMMLAAGTHDLEFVNDAVGFRVRRTTVVQAGRTTTLKLEAPAGTLNVNALPWAEVWVDDRRIGETPIGNIVVPIGSRNVIFRHPELGERRTTVLVTLKAPARVSVDLRTR